MSIMESMGKKKPRQKLNKLGRQDVPIELARVALPWVAA
jgi:hypothetical protein